MSLKILRNRLNSSLNAFLSSNSEFSIIHTTSNSLSHKPSKFLVLDSSFNPPHKGHYSLIQKALNQKGNLKTPVLLLLSVKNADKLTPQPADFVDRLTMMYLFSEHITKELGVNVSVGLTIHAKFVDKSSSIRKWLNLTFKHTESIIKLVFLLGFDTIIRIFDPKYYKPYSLKTALDGFLVNNELFCLTRGANDDNIQKTYLQDIQKGEIYPEIPTDWSKHIILDHGDPQFLKVSSSIIRKDHTVWDSFLIKSIKDYIKETGLYI